MFGSRVLDFLQQDNEFKGGKLCNGRRKYWEVRRDKRERRKLKLTDVCFQALLFVRSYIRSLFQMCPL